MSLAAYKKSILIKNATSTAAYVEMEATDATLTLAGDVLDDTDFTSTGMRSRILGLRDWNISAPSNFNSTAAWHILVYGAWRNRRSLAIKYLSNGISGYKGNTVVETFTHTGDVGGLETLDISLQADGPLSTTT